MGDCNCNNIATTNDGTKYILLSDESGKLFMKSEKNTLTEVRESGFERRDKGFKVCFGYYKKGNRFSALTRSNDSKVLFAWMDSIPDVSEEKPDIYWEELPETVGEDMFLIERIQGGLEAFRLDPDGELWHMWTNPQQEWSLWQSLGESLKQGFWVVNNDEGFPQVIAMNKEGKLCVRRHKSNGMWVDWIYLDEELAGIRQVALENHKLYIYYDKKDGISRVLHQDEDPDCWI